ncbi:MAG: hypothetical protein M3406_07770 [Chloroflexota bacterium]|nr:hypothetical protein [Chloroflexota bacterium]
MRFQRRLIVPGLLALPVLLSACFPPFGPFFPFPPAGETELSVENGMDDNVVLRIVADDFPMEYAIPAGETGTVILYGGSAPTTIALLDADCQSLDEIEWTETSEAVRIGPDGQLAAVARPATAPDEIFIEYWECTGGFGPAPTAGDPVTDAPGTIFLAGSEGSGWRIDPATAELSHLATSDTEAGGMTMDAEHALSPDGALVAFSRYAPDDGSADLYVAAIDGGDERLLVADAGIPSWSPDGTRIAYLSLDPFAGGSAIHVIDLDGGDPIELADDASVPRWSPDGTRIAFISVDLGGFSDPTTSSSELRVVNADGTELETLASASPFADRPDWSPDGKRLVFTAGSDTDGTVDVIDLDSGNLSTVANGGSAMLTEPTWSPDGERIAFGISDSTIFSSEAAVGIVPATGGEVERIGALDNGFIAGPVWSPDGAWLAFARSGAMDAASDLVVRELASGEETVLASGVLSVSGWR